MEEASLLAAKRSKRQVNPSLRHLLIACCIAICAFSTLGAQAFLCAGHAADEPLSAAKIAGEVRLPVLPASGSIYVLTVFARFADEEPTPVPEWADQLFDAEREGSFAHFYHAMSFGQLAIAGEVLPRRLASSQPASAYLADAPGQARSLRRFRARDPRPSRCPNRLGSL